MDEFPDDKKSHSKLVDGIEIGKKYPLFLDQSGEKVLSLQYLFKPVSIDQQVCGTLKCNTAGESNVEIKCSNGELESFRGLKRSLSAADHEYVIEFLDGGKCVLSKVDDQILNLKLQKKDDRVKAKAHAVKESKEIVDSLNLPKKFLQKVQQAQASKKKAAVAAEAAAKIASESNNVVSADSLIIGEIEKTK
jgi:hypothetical protein